MSVDEWGGLNRDLPLQSESVNDDEDESVAAARREHEDLVSSWVAGSSYTIPGMAEKPDDCGVYLPYQVCEECGNPIFVESKCGQRKCPDCWREWVLERAEKMVVRLQAYRWAQDDGLDRRLVHAMFSPNKEDWTIRETEEMMSDSYDLASDAGVSGGCALKHIWRTKDDLDSEFEAATAAGFDYGKWKYLRKEYGRNWREGVEESPHVHQVAIASEFEPDADGWMAKRIRTLRPFYRLSDPESYADVAGLCKYLLTHTALKDGEQAVRWFGDMYPGGFNPEEELSSGALDTIERLAEQAVYGEKSDDDDDDTNEVQDECKAETEGCQGEPMPIWDVPIALRQDFFDVSRETEKKLKVCVNWMMGDLDPPPIYSKSKAEELLDEMVEEGDYNL